MKKAVWLDCDPGHDDALALILAGYHPGLELLGVSTVAANQTVAKVTKNALEILDASGLHSVGVFMGQDKPILRPRLQCPEIHGDSGLALKNGSLPPTQTKARSGKAVPAIFDHLQQHYESRGQKVHVVCTGALTNIALLLILFPEVSAFVEQITLMGGAVGSGNTNPSAEFNMQVDPEAAKAVFESGLPVVMVPLEVTHTALATHAIIETMMGKDPTSPFLQLIREIVQYFSGTYLSVFGFKDPPIHDPCAVFYIANPTAFKVEQMRVDIETVSPLTAGQTVCDIYHMSPLPKNVIVCKEMDVASFWEAQIGAIHAACDASPMRSF